MGGTGLGWDAEAIPDPKATAGVWTGRAGWGCRALEKIPSASGDFENRGLFSASHAHVSGADAGS